MSSEKKTLIISLIGTSLLLLIFQLTLIYNHFYSLSADESGHTLQAYYWYKGNYSIFGVWLPFYKILVGSLLNIYNNLFLMPRIISMVFGTSTLIGIMLLSDELFHQPLTTFLTGFLGALFFPLVILSVVPLMEIMYFFFVIVSLLFLIKYLDTKRVGLLFISTSFCAVATTIRYEAWIFAGVIFLLLAFLSFIKKVELKIKHLSATFLILFIFPFVWIILYSFDAHAFGFISSVSSVYHPGPIYAEIKNNVLFQFIELNFRSLNIIGIIVLIFFVVKSSNVRRFIFAAFFPLLIFGIYSFIYKTMPTHNFWRIAGIWSILLLPFTAYWLNSLTDSTLINKSLGKISFFVILVVVSISFITQTLDRSSKSYFTENDLQAGKYLNSLIRKNNYNILIEPARWKFLNIIVASEHPDRFVKNGRSNNAKFLSVEAVQKDTVNDKELFKLGIKYLIFQSDGLKQIIEKEPNIIKQKDFHNWRIYKLQ